MESFKFKTDELDTAFNNILDTFGGADGGISFVRFRSFLEKLENPKCIADEESSNKLIKIVLQFNKMIDIANGRLK
jgi:hypothetical protein